MFNVHLPVLLAIALTTPRVHVCFLHVLIAVSSATAADTIADRSSVSEKSAVHLEELMQRLDSGNIQLIDIREPDDIEEMGAISTSINIPCITNISLIHCTHESQVLKKSIFEIFAVKQKCFKYNCVTAIMLRMFF